MSEFVEPETLATPVRRVAWSTTPSAWPTGRIIAGLAEAEPISARIRPHEPGLRKPGRTNNPRWPRILTFGMLAAFRRDLTLADRSAGRPASRSHLALQLAHLTSSYGRTYICCVVGSGSSCSR